MFKGTPALVLVLSASVYSCCRGSDTILPFSFFLSRSGPVSYEGVLPAVELALSLVNNDTSLLPGFTLEYPQDAFVDAMCSATPSLQGFVNNLFEPPTKVFILGPDCSTPTLSVAELTQFWNLVQISFAATASSLSDKGSYPFFLRTVASDQIVPLGIVALMKQFNWDRIGIITQQEDAFTGTARQLETALAEEGFLTQGDVIFTAGSSAQMAINAIKNTGSRIIFLNVNSDQAAGLLCQALAQDLILPDYVWITYGWYFDSFWRLSTSAATGSCSASDLVTIVQGMLFVGHSTEQDPQARIIGNLTKQGFREEYNRLHQTQFDSDGSLPEEAAAAYDAVWTAALALNVTEVELAMNNSSLANFTYFDDTATQLFYRNCLQVSFSGASGYVTFDANGDRLPFGHIQQYRLTTDGSDLERVTFATFNGTNLVFSDGEGSATIFPDGPPADKAFLLIPVPLFAVYTVLAIVGVAFAIVCAAFNIIFWNKVIIFITQPILNVIFCAGAGLAYFLVILLGLDETFLSAIGATVNCNFIIWLGVVAFKLTFGALFAKALRIYYIFYYYRVHSLQKDIPSPFLVLIVACLLGVDLFFLFVVTVVDTARLERNSNLLNVNPDGTPPTFYHTCTSTSYEVWFPIFLTLSAVELMVGAFLAFEARKVNIRELSDSKLIALSIYSHCIVCVALIPIAYLLDTFVIEQYAVFGALLLASVTFILCLLFVPKMIGLYKDPTGEKDVALHGLQAVKSMEWDNGSGTLPALESERDTLKMEIRKLLQMPQVTLSQEGNGGTAAEDQEVTQM